MSNCSLNNKGRVEYIKKKFENSLSEEIKSVPPKTSFVKVCNKYKVNSFNENENIFNFDTESSKANKNANKTEGRVQIKRNPAFRRDKIMFLKNFGKKDCSKKQDAVEHLIIEGPLYHKNSEEVDPVKLCEKDTESQSLKKNTDVHQLRTEFSNYCDLKEKNFTIRNSTKNTLVTRKVNLLDNIEKQSNDQETLPSYAVVNKNLKKNVTEKKHKENEVKLSESLRKALQSPLPKGPPPKKPPRTFCHVMPGEVDKDDSKTQKDLPSLKSKLEKLENAIKNHERKTIVCNGNFKADLEEKLKKISKPVDFISQQKSLSSKNESQSCLQFTNCVNPVTDNENYAKFTKESESNRKVGKIEPHNWQQKPEKEESVRLNFAEKMLSAKKSNDAEPVYDLPCIAKETNEKKLSKVKNLDVNKNNRDQGLHYLCTDVIKKLDFDKLLEFSTEDDNLKGCNKNSQTMLTAKPDMNSTQNVADSKGEKRETAIDWTSTLVSTGVNNPVFDELYVKSDSDSWSSDSDKDWSRNKGSLCAKDLGENGKFEKCSVTMLTDEEVLSRRKDYISKVSSRLFNCVPYWKCIKENNYSHLFEYCMLVGLTLESERNVPYIKTIFPPDKKPPPLIESLCFPDAALWPPSTKNDQPEEQYYSLVITNENGERKFGYCRRVLPEGGNICLPLTYCIITPHRANGFFYKVLQELESRHGSAGIDNFIKQLYESQFPGPGEGLKLKKILEEVTKSSVTTTETYLPSTLVRRPCDVRMEEKDLTQLFQHLHLSVFLEVFSSLLHERKVLLLSNSLRKLSSSIEALQSILLPFSWQHTYIPVLPVHLVEMCEAPTPYVIGLLKSKDSDNSLSNIVFENGIIVDLDDSKILKCCGDERRILPQRLIKSLKTSLNLAVNASLLPDVNRNVLISDAFISFFVHVCGHYSKFIFLCDGQKIFEKKGFIKFVNSTTTQTFLEWFTNTAMFQAFIHERLHGIVEDVPVKLFTLRAMEYSSEILKNSTVLNYKVINKKVKSLSDKIKDFIQ